MSMRVLVLSCVMACYASTIHATVTPADQQKALQNQNQILRQQEQLFEELKRQQQKSLPQQTSPKITVPPTPKTSMPSGGPCFHIHTITFTGANILSAGTQKKLTAPYSNRCLTMQDIATLQEDITSYYNIKQGYTASHARIAPQDLSQGTLEVNVIEKILKNISYNPNSPTEQSQLATAFPWQQGRILRLRDLEQGLDQMNRLKSNNATMEILAGETLNEAIVAITNQPQPRTRIYLTYDNAGQRSTGKRKGGLRLEQDNLLGINDAWSVSLGRDAFTKNSQKNSTTHAISLAVPLGYWTLEGSINRAEYHTVIDGSIQDFSSAGTTDSTKVKLSRTISRDQKNKTNLHAALTHKDTKSFIAQVQTDAGSRELAVVHVGLDHTARIDQGAIILNAAYERGLKAFHALKDPPNLGIETPRAQFQKIIAGISSYKYLGTYVYTGSLQGQHSNDPLYSSEKISIGDRYTVRGFHETSVQGDSGLYSRNELSRKLDITIENAVLNAMFSNLEPYIGIDAGIARNRGGKTSSFGQGYGYISGAAIGLRKTHRHVDLDFTIAKPIKAPSFVDKNAVEIYFTLTLKSS